LLILCNKQYKITSLLEAENECYLLSLVLILILAADSIFTPYYVI